MIGSYSAGGTVNRFDSLQMFMVTGNSKNINNQFTGTEHPNGPGSGLQSSDNLQLNYRDTWSRKLTATLDAGRSFTNSSVNTELNRRTSLGDSSIVQNSLSGNNNKSTSYNAYAAFK